MKTVYRVFDRFDQAERAMQALSLAGLPAEQIAVLTGQPVDGGMFPVEIAGIGHAAANARMRDLLSGSPSGGSGMRGALLGLGVSSAEIERCAGELRRGRTLEAIVVDDAQAADASTILTRFAGHDGPDPVEVPEARDEPDVAPHEGVQMITVLEERITVERRIVERPIDDSDDRRR